MDRNKSEREGSVARGCLFGKMVSEGFIEKVTLEQRELDVRIPGEDCPKQEVVMQRLRTEWGRDVSQKKMMSRSWLVDCLKQGATGGL